jgi:hypothetical protein
MKIRLNIILFGWLLVLPALAFGEFKNGLHLTTMMGCSVSGPSPLTIKFQDQPQQTLSARYKNRCFEDSHWWAFRLENWTNRTGIGFELIHHKIYLANTTDLVESFSVSDGYNLLFLNFAKQIEQTNYRVGVGVVLGHMDVTIKGRDRFIRKGFKGHYLTGPAFQLNVERILWESDRHFVSLDSKFTAAYAEIPISSNPNELAIAPDYAVHFSLALGSKPIQHKDPTLKDRMLYMAPMVYPITVGTVIGTGLLPNE